MKHLYCLKWYVIICCFLAVNSLAQTNINLQEDKYAGDWYISSNTIERNYYGPYCGIEIVKVDLHYELFHKDPQYADFSPPEGKYFLKENGDLIKDGLVIQRWKDKLIYNPDGRGNIVLSSLAYQKILDSIFREGAYYIDFCDSPGIDKKVYILNCMNDMKRVLAEDRQCIGCYYNISLCWYKLEELDSASVYYLDGVKVNPSFPQMDSMRDAIADKYISIGWHKYGEKGDFKRAIRQFENAIKIDSSSKNAWYNLGGACYSDGQYEEAVKAFSTAIILDPDNADARAGLHAAEDKLNEK